MDLISVALASGSVHDVTENTSAGGAFWAVVVILLSIIGFLLVRDRNAIQKSLDSLVTSVNDLLKEVSKLREDLAKNYATKQEVLEVHRRVDKITGWMKKRGAKIFGEGEKLDEDDEQDPAP